MPSKKNYIWGGGSCRILECASTLQKMALKAIFGHFWPLVTPQNSKKTFFFVKIIFIGFLSRILPFDNLIIDKYCTPHITCNVGCRQSPGELIHKAGAEVESRSDQYGDTAFHRSANCGHIHVVTRLLDSGRGLEAVDNTGYTPGLHGRVTRRQQSVWGCQIETQDDDKWTPLRRASGQWHIFQIEKNKTS